MSFAVDSIPVSGFLAAMEHMSSSNVACRWDGIDGQVHRRFTHIQEGEYELYLAAGESVVVLWYDTRRAQ